MKTASYSNLLRGHLAKFETKGYSQQLRRVQGSFGPLHASEEELDVDAFGQSLPPSIGFAPPFR